MSVGSGGGTSVNSIASEAWMEVDLRSSDRAALAALDAAFQKALDDALAEENERWGNRGRLTLTKTLVGNRPAGRTWRDTPIVQAAVSVTRALGLPVSLDEGSTDANLAMSLDIPAITIDGGGTATGDALDRRGVRFNGFVAGNRTGVAPGAGAVEIDLRRRVRGHGTALLGDTITSRRN